MPLTRPRRARLAHGLALVAMAALLAAPDASASSTADATASISTEAAAPVATTYRINGNPNGQRGLEVWRGSCTTSGDPGQTNGFQFGYGNGQPFPYGPLSVTWAPDRLDSAIALRATTQDPGNVDRFDVQVYHPSDSVTGFASVSYRPDKNVDEEWLGRSAIIDSQEGWHPIFAASVTYQWTHLVNGVPDGLPAAASTLAEMAEMRGTPRDEARMGFAFGCDGRVTYVDGLRLGSTTDGWDVFDMVGRPSSISLQTPGKYETCQVSAVRYPSTVEVSGRIRGLKRWAIWRLDDRGRLVRRLSQVEVSESGRYRGTVRIKRTSQIAAYAPNTGTTESAVSRAVRVGAVPQIDFFSGDRSAVRGRGLSVAGRIKPGQRVRYTALLTTWTGSSWTPYRAIDTGRTDAKGRFRVNAPTGSLGFARISILTKATKKVNAALSRTAVTYRVDPEPRRSPDSFGDSRQPEASSPPPGPGPVVIPIPPTEGEGETPGPMPEPGRVSVQQAKGGYGVCGWKPPAGRP